MFYVYMLPTFDVHFTHLAHSHIMDMLHLVVTWSFLDTPPTSIVNFRIPIKWRVNMNRYPPWTVLKHFFSWRDWFSSSPALLGWCCRAVSFFWLSFFPMVKIERGELKRTEQEREKVNPSCGWGEFKLGFEGGCSVLSCWGGEVVFMRRLFL